MPSAPRSSAHSLAETSAAMVSCTAACKPQLPTAIRVSICPSKRHDGFVASHVGCHASAGLFACTCCQNLSWNCPRLMERCGHVRTLKRLTAVSSSHLAFMRFCDSSSISKDIQGLEEAADSNRASLCQLILRMNSLQLHVWLLGRAKHSNFLWAVRDLTHPQQRSTWRCRGEALGETFGVFGCQRLCG